MGSRDFNCEQCKDAGCGSCSTIKEKPACVCSYWYVSTLGDIGEHHHKRFANYDKEKFPYLFYYEEGIDAWCPAPDVISGVLDLDSLDANEARSIEFKKLMLTDKEYLELSEL